MKKFLLLFMSMFFMLGTSVAQEKEEENAAFALQYSTPANGEFTFTVYNIRLQFNKEIVVTLPEGGIAVTNKNTGDVVKITRLDNNEWIEKSTAVFLFEQKTVVGKEGKEELQDLVIDIPGEWSYTIPAGCIKSIDGEEFAEQTFTFTIASSMEIESVSPADAVTKLDKIEVTFPKAIASVNTGKLSLFDNSCMPVAFKSEVTYSDDRKTVTLELETPMTAPGTYSLNIYQGAFQSEDGALSIYREVSFQVIDPTPSFATNLKNGDKVKELPEYLEFTFKNVNEVKLVEGADPVMAYLPGNGEAEGTTTLEGNKVVVNFGQKFTEEGVYTYWIPEGLFTMDGVPNETFTMDVTLYSFEIVPLEVVSVTPVEGAVNQIEKIVVEFNQLVRLSYDENSQQISREITLKGDTKEYVLTYAPSSWSATNKVEYLVNANWNGYDYESTPLLDEGTYTLSLKDIIVDYAAEDYIDEWVYPDKRWNVKNACIDKTYTWTIADTAIDGIEAENGEKVIYDLTGRRIENITDAGIYIVNGKKVLVK